MSRSREQSRCKRRQLDKPEVQCLLEKIRNISMNLNGIRADTILQNNKNNILFPKFLYLFIIHHNLGFINFFYKRIKVFSENF